MRMEESRDSFKGSTFETRDQGENVSYIPIY